MATPNENSYTTLKARGLISLLTAIGAVVVAAAALLIIPAMTGHTSPAKPPNILFVMTDDQPMDTMMAMPEVKSQVRDRGMTLINAYVSESLCCPSRASILRGQYPHNTDVMRNDPPHGGVKTFQDSGEKNTVAHWLDNKGYSTALIGKYMNGYDARYMPSGWDYWYAKADASTSGEKVNSNGHVIDFAGKPGNWGDRFKAKAMDYLNRRTDQASDGPFALFFWTGQPHLQAADYANRYAKLYSKASLDPKPSFDEQDVSDKPKWVRNLGRIDARERAKLKQWHINQLRSVRQVDDTVGAMLDLLSKRGELANTYVVFTTDNNTHMGEHRWFGKHGAKNTPYEEAANVLMYVRGPGIPPGSTSDKLVLNNDLAPTFLSIAESTSAEGTSLPSFVDGRNLLPVWKNNAPDWRTAIMNERPLTDVVPVPPYHAVITERYTYVEYDTGEKELYDRIADPYEMNSLHNTADPTLLESLHTRLQALEGCAGHSPDSSNPPESCSTAEDTP